MFVSADVMFRFVYLRGHFQKQLRKVEKTPSGSGGTVTPKWEYFEACTFLTPVYSKVQTVDNVQPQPDLAEVIYEGTLEDLMDASEKEDKPFIGHILSSSLAITPAASQIASPQNTTKWTAQEALQEVEQTITCASSPIVTLHPTPSSNSCEASNTATKPSVPAIPTWTPKHQRKTAKTKDEMTHETLLETLKCVQSMMNAQEKRPAEVVQDIATQSLMSFMKYVPDTHKHIKMECTEKIMSVVTECLKKYHSETQNQV
ncbi:hypothetical protein GWK47_020992 [Chionoecetes opilio]|uniref:MADF domain-containing protein n=1 Tax=Chionoecetes opilio TaxID=41210 RepID=A0A8J4XSN1_CHIOP|nr:hypothetical protein GWK47_020992 [Chionoecetes opilio]